MPWQFASRARVGAALLGVVLAQVACGGGGGGAGKPAAGAPGGEGEGGQGVAGGGLAGEGPGGPAAPPSACRDEGCFLCGDGACPRGFYCDEGAAGGAACSWAPECGAEQDCACLGRLLTGCACQTEGGGSLVKCGGQ